MRPLSLLLLAAFAAPAVAAPLTLGDKAPPLKIATTVKGKAPDLSKGIHVVEFWATWCGPCRTSIPHLTELAKKHAGKVSFTGVDVWEKRAEPGQPPLQLSDYLPDVQSFVKNMGDKMDYNVVVDGPEGTMAQSWMAAAEQQGIPTAFVVKDGVVQWIGHPMGGLDETLDKMLAGTYDLQAEKTRIEAEQKAQAEMQALMAPLSEAMEKKDYDAALKALDEITTSKPELKSRMGSLRTTLLVNLGQKEGYDQIAAMADGMYANEPQGLNMLAWMIVGDDSEAKNPDYALGLRIAEKAVELSKGKDANILDTLAAAQAKSGKLDDAIATQKKALAAADADPAFPANAKGGLKKRLEDLEKQKKG